jgi:N-acetylneuraminate synthase/N,N'-diacetyllegionaminate synthase
VIRANKVVRIGKRSVGEGHPCYIIAEAGSNHNRNKSTARKLIEVAAEAGVDAVKFQTYSAETLYSKKTPRFTNLKDRNVYDLIKEIELPRQWQGELSDICKSHGVDFMSSPFDNQAIDELAELDVPAYKIASFELVDLDLIAYAASKKKPMILSTGMANLGDIEDAVRTVLSKKNKDVILLHCNSLYPTPMEIVNLRAMDTIRSAFNVPIGFSDHTLGIMMAQVAVARGANVIEKHYTLDQKMKGPDHSFAIEPDELAALCKGIRDIETALGTGLKDRSPEEEENYIKARRSIVARVNIPKGTVITEGMLINKRPGFGIPPKFKKLVVGRIARTDIEEDDVITWDLV